MSGAMAKRFLAVTVRMPSAMMRAITSVDPPTPSGTTMMIGRDG
jgi:hypothetical protein